MTRQKALELTRDIRISDNEDDLCFKAMVIFWIGANYKYDKDKTAKTTKYNIQDVETVFKNWEINEILVNGNIHGEFDGENDWMEIILISMCGAGELVRISEHENNDTVNKYGVTALKPEIQMTTPKTLNEHLFAQLDRLSSADEKTIETEINKAAAIVQVAGKVLEVARLKLDIIQAGTTAQGFEEIDTKISSADDKKKLQ